VAATGLEGASQRRWLVAGGWGLASALLARVVLLAASAPHSVLLFLFPLPAWHLPVAGAIGLVTWLALFLRWRQPGRAALAVAIGALLLALVAHRLVFDVDLVNGWWPGFWTETP
jgi:hypothetical protein